MIGLKRKLSLVMFGILLVMVNFLGIMVEICLAGDKEIEEKVKKELERSLKELRVNLDEVEKRAIIRGCSITMKMMEECAHVYSVRGNCMEARQKMYEIARKIFWVKGLEKKGEKAVYWANYVIGSWAELCKAGCREPMGYDMDKDIVFKTCVNYLIMLYKGVKKEE